MLYSGLADSSVSVFLIHSSIRWTSSHANPSSSFISVNFCSFWYTILRSLSKSRTFLLVFPMSKIAITSFILLLCYFAPIVFHFPVVNERYLFVGHRFGTAEILRQPGDLQQVEVHLVHRFHRFHIFLHTDDPPVLNGDHPWGVSVLAPKLLVLLIDQVGT